MGNNNNNGRGHWTESSNVLRDSERLRTRPFPPPRKSNPEETQPHFSGTLFETEHQHDSGYYVKGTGPNVHVGAKSTEDMTRLDGQVNYGGVSVGHRNENHDYSMGLNWGYGGGMRLHHGKMEGIGGDLGPVSFDFKQKPSKDSFTFDERLLFMGD